MTTYKKHKRTHSNQQNIEPYYTIRYLLLLYTCILYGHIDHNML